METNEKIKMLRLGRGLTLEQVADYVGVSKGTVQKWESGLIQNMKRDKIARLAEVLGTTPDYLIGWSDEGATLMNGIIPMPRMKSIPLSGEIACGSPILAVQNFEELVDLPEHIHADFALQCKGDSMINARIFDGDIVYIREQPTVENGQIAAVLIADLDNTATLKRVYISSDHILLQAENPAFPPMVYTGEEMSKVHILGLAVAFTSAVK